MAYDDPHPDDYTGLHAFLFIDHVAEGTTPEQLVKAIRDLGKPPIWYASTFVGDYIAFAHVRANDVAELQDLIEQIGDLGARCAWSAESAFGTAGVKRKSPNIIALTRIKTQRRAITQEFLDTLSSQDGVVGVSVITGNFDVILQVEGEDFQGAAANVQAALESVEGIVRTSTAFADGSRTEYKHGAIELT